MTMRFRFFRPLAAALLGAAALAPMAANAAGDLLVAPTRVVLNGSQGTEVILNNIGSEPATYRISLELRRMTPTGELQDVTVEEANALEQAAMEMIRYAPRRVLLAPDQPQAIRISARPPAELADGEYRAHMLFRAVPEATPVTEQSADAPATGFIIKLTPIYGITIPIIIRKGQLEATAAIANPAATRLPNGATELAFDVSRSGARSVFGEVHVIPAGGKTPHITRGIAVYPEVSQRRVAIMLPPDVAAQMQGAVRIEYREPLEQGGRLIAAIDTNIVG